MVDWIVTMKTYLQKWFSEPLVIPRWMLSAKYAFFAILGLLAAIAGIPSFDITTFSGYTTPWSAGIVIAASFAFYASLEQSRERHMEKWSVIALVSLLGAYLVAAWIPTIAEFNLGRVIFCWLVTGILMLPTVRAGSLLRKYGLRRVG